MVISLALVLRRADAPLDRTRRPLVVPPDGASARSCRQRCRTHSSRSLHLVFSSLCLTVIYGFTD
jgi:hypothetical protein